MPKLYFDTDADLGLMADQTVAAIGFGTQGMGQALNLRDSGLKVIVGEEAGSKAWALAEAEGFETFPYSEAVQRASIFNLQVPDMAFRLADVYNQAIKPHHRPGDLIVLSSAFNFYYGHMSAPEGVDAIVCAPKSPGSAVRSEYVKGRGIPGLLAIHQDATGHAHARGLALCKALGWTRVGVQDTTIEEEAVTDLLGEHCAWGCIAFLLLAVFEVLVEAGYDPNVAFFEAIQESKLTTELIYRYGLAGMMERISNTAAYGALTIGPRIIDEGVKNKIRWAMENIRDGGFSRDWEQDYKDGYRRFNALVEQLRVSQADQVGNEIRQHLGVLKEEGDLKATNR
ncbi:MAG: ketol-acid reductoisomerase [Anaerolineae bacterium]